MWEELNAQELCLHGRCSASGIQAYESNKAHPWSYLDANLYCFLIGMSLKLKDGLNLVQEECGKERQCGAEDVCCTCSLKKKTKTCFVALANFCDTNISPPYPPPWTRSLSSKLGKEAHHQPQRAGSGHPSSTGFSSVSSIVVWWMLWVERHILCWKEAMQMFKFISS